MSSVVKYKYFAFFYFNKNIKWERYFTNVKLISFINSYLGRERVYYNVLKLLIFNFFIFNLTPYVIQNWPILHMNAIYKPIKYVNKLINWHHPKLGQILHPFKLYENEIDFKKKKNELIRK